MLEEGDLLAFVDGTTNETVTQHIANCPYCAAQVEAYQRMQQAFGVGFYRRSCPAPERLALYQLNLLPAKDKLLLSTHVRRCPYCQEELELLASEGEAPSILTRVRHAIEVVEATLKPLPRRVAGVRGTAPALLQYESATLTLQLSVQSGHTRGTRTLLGRVLSQAESPRSPAGQDVWLITPEEGWVTSVHGDGTFTFEHVAPGTYTLAVDKEETVIIAQDIAVT
jgi:anti-sigma factor RsiW